MSLYEDYIKSKRGGNAAFNTGINPQQAGQRDYLTQLQNSGIDYSRMSPAEQQAINRGYLDLNDGYGGDVITGNAGGAGISQNAFGGTGDGGNYITGYDDPDKYGLFGDNPNEGMYDTNPIGFGETLQGVGSLAQGLGGLYGMYLGKKGLDAQIDSYNDYKQYRDSEERESDAYKKSLSTAFSR